MFNSDTLIVLGLVAMLILPFLFAAIYFTIIIEFPRKRPGRTEPKETSPAPNVAPSPDA